MKLPRPDNYDGKPKTPFRPWWNKVTYYFRFYPETIDAQRIAFVGALLTDEAQEWHQARDQAISRHRGIDNWAAYSEALQAEYTDPHEAATAHAELMTLKYKGDIKAFLTSFRTLNWQAGSTGEGLQDIINKALPDKILDVRSFQNRQALRTDDDFLTATYEAGRHVEELQALKVRRTQSTPTTGGSKPTEKKDGQSRQKAGKASTGQGERDPRPSNAEGTVTKRAPPTYGGQGEWPSHEACMRGVPEQEIASHRANRGCHRCGKKGHMSNTCFAKKTQAGTLLPASPVAATAVAHAPTKRRREEDEEPTPAPKQQKVAAAEVMDLEGPPAIWAEESSSEQDFC
jgi:hypothetical protein